MTRPRLVPFKAEHMLEFVNRDTLALAEWKFAIEKERGGPAFTAIIDDVILGCAGVMLVWPGVGVAWLAASKSMNKHTIWMTRLTRMALTDVMRSFHLHRVEAVVLTSNEHNLRWIELLGFKREKNVARAYTQDRRSVVRFERINR